MNMKLSNNVITLFKTLKYVIKKTKNSLQLKLKK